MSLWCWQGTGDHEQVFHRWPSSKRLNWILLNKPEKERAAACRNWWGFFSVIYKQNKETKEGKVIGAAEMVYGNDPDLSLPICHGYITLFFHPVKRGCSDLHKPCVRWHLCWLSNQPQVACFGFGTCRVNTFVLDAAQIWPLSSRCVHHVG